MVLKNPRHKINKADLPKENWFDIRLQNDDAASQMEGIQRTIKIQGPLDKLLKDKKKKLTSGDELPPGVQKMVKFI